MESTLADAVGGIVADRDTSDMILLQRALDRIADDFGAMTATLHAVDPGADPIRPDLVSIADRGIPESVRAHTRLIPFGKGMAGLCAERRAAVTVCNLQTDASGVARPGARETGVAGAIVVPIFDALSGRLVGTLGIGKPGEHTYLEEEIGTLAACAEKLAPIVVRAAALGGSR